MSKLTAEGKEELERLYDSVHLSERTANALDALNLVAVETTNMDLGAMAWLALVLKYVDDDEKTFPAGKWATIQFIGEQLDRCALAEADRLLGRNDA